MRPFGDFIWRDIGDGVLWKFADGDGDCLADVAFEKERGQRWSWCVTMPPSYQEDNASPCGLAKSAAAAKAICESILLGTGLKR